MMFFLLCPKSKSASLVIRSGILARIVKRNLNAFSVEETYTIPCPLVHVPLLTPCKNDTTASIARVGI